ncbi:MAG: L,D-transpeptidase [Hyphomicrobiaceae bacterium]|nr:L,D-transpeptidase [Hyphomicrobiaceae bacterium]
MQRFLIVAGLALATAAPASAQSWVPWHQSDLLTLYGERGRPAPAATKPKATTGSVPASAVRTALAARPGDPDDDDEAPTAAAQPRARAVVDGGPRPEIDPKPPATVTYDTGQSPGTIVIDTAARRLYLTQGGGRALAYPVSVGREGFTWSGTEKISRVANWPDWHPPAEMRERDPKLPLRMTGGLRNPLGAKALYLGSSLYRIHGTSDARSIGQAASSGCFRMHNAHVVDLAQRVGIGTKVVVINAPAAKTASAAGSRSTRRTAR